MRRVFSFGLLVAAALILLASVGGAPRGEWDSEQGVASRAAPVVSRDGENMRVADDENKTAQPPSPEKQAAAVGETLRQEGVATSGEHAVVLSIIDGDTVEVELNSGVVERVRYIGIDTPETVHPSKPVECYGREAAAKNRALVAGREVALERDVTDRDRYGRLLRYVYIGDTFVNEALVRGGFAHAYPYPPDVRYEARFRDAEREAREARVGLWGAACEVSTVATPPASAHPMQAAAPGDCVIKGNINVKGEKIYHLPGCGSYEKTVVSEASGERWFCSEADARAAGWRRAKNCP